MKLRYRIQDSGVRLALVNGPVLELTTGSTFEVDAETAQQLLTTGDGLPDPRFEVAE